MSNIIVALLLSAILKAVKPELDPTPMQIIIFAALIIDCVRLISWRINK